MNSAHLPAITSVPLTANQSTRRFKGKHLTYSRPLRPPRPLCPGDVYRRPRTSSCPVNQPRPLGLLPNRSLETWKSMMRMLATSATERTVSEEYGSASVCDTEATETHDVPYRCPALVPAKLIDSSPGNDDRAYRELLLRCRIAEYGLLKEGGGSGLKRASPQRPNTRGFCKKRPVCAVDTEVRLVLLIPTRASHSRPSAIATDTHILQYT